MVALKSSAIVILTAISAISATKYVYVDETTTLGYPVHTPTPTSSSAVPSYEVTPSKSNTSVQSVSSSSVVVSEYPTYVPTACAPVTVTLPPVTVTVTVTPAAATSEPPKQPEYVVTPPKQPENVVTPPKQPENVVTPPKQPENVVTPPKQPEYVVTPPKQPEYVVTPPKQPEYVVTPPKQPGYIVKPPKQSETATKPATQPTPTPKPSSSVSPPAPKPSNPPTQPPSGGKGDEMLCRVNHIRAQNGKAPVHIDDRLMMIAKMQSADQNARKQMTHVGIKYPGLDQRLTFSKFKWNGGCENIAAGQKTTEDAVVAWKNSPGHLGNMLAGNDCFGYANDGGYWTQVFAKGDKCTSTTLPDCSGYKF